MATYLKYLLAFLFLGLLSLSLRPVPKPEKDNLKQAGGTVEKIWESGTGDVSIKLAGTKKVFYINRGLERGLNLENLQRKLVGRKVALQYIGHWTPLAPFDDGRHIAKLFLPNEMIYDETTVIPRPASLFPGG